MAGDPVFVDTNVLVYATRSSAHSMPSALAEGEGSTLWVSPQVLREYLGAVTRPQASAPALTMATAIADTNVVATMIEHGLRRLLTFNAADFRRFAPIIDIEPIP